VRLRICRQPPESVDGLPLTSFRAGVIYDLGPSLTSLFLAEGWAEPVVRVLVIDDDRDIRTLTARILVDNGYDVAEARHGAEAIQSLGPDPPDLILLDLDMPVMNGWQFRRKQLRLADARCASIPVLLLTAADGAATHARRMMAVGVIAKPYDPDHLVATIRAALGRQPS
jgi:CheY-like chemotaxis protein